MWNDILGFENLHSEWSYNKLCKSSGSIHFVQTCLQKMEIVLSLYLREFFHAKIIIGLKQNSECIRDVLSREGFLHALHWPPSFGNFLLYLVRVDRADSFAELSVNSVRPRREPHLSLGLLQSLLVSITGVFSDVSIGHSYN